MFSFRFGTYSFRCGMNSYRSGIHSFRCNFSHSVPDKHDWPRSCPGRRCGRSGSRGAAAARAAPRSGWSCPPGSPPLSGEKISDACEIIEVIIRYYGDQGGGSVKVISLLGQLRVAMECISFHHSKDSKDIRMVGKEYFRADLQTKSFSGNAK